MILTDNGKILMSPDGKVYKSTSDELKIARSILDKSITEYSDSEITEIGDSAFREAKNLQNVYIPNVTKIKGSAFYYCNKLKNIDLSNVVEMGSYAFRNCAFEHIDLPKVTTLGYCNFYDCTKMKSIYVPNATTLDQQCLNGNSILKKIVIEQTEVVTTLKNTSAFVGCYHILGKQNSTYNPNGDHDGYIYVPASLLSQYKVATNWATYETQIIGHQDFNVGDTLPSYANDTYTTCTWYSDETLTNIVTSVATQGRYYCRLEA